MSTVTASPAGKGSRGQNSNGSLARVDSNSNDDDRCQRQKQEGAVGAAACKMRVPLQGTKQMQGAATRIFSAEIQ